MKQETVCAIPAELFSVSDSGASSSKGACVCAVVVLPSRPAKYTLVCYNAQQVTFCVARMSWADAHNTSLRLIVAPSGHVSFTDDTNQRWTLFFAEEAQLLRFLACVGVAFYALYGAPATSVYQQDLSLPSSSMKLDAADRAAVSFTEFELLDKNGVYSAGAMKAQRGVGGEGDDAVLYSFLPKSSAVQLSHGCFGFEGSVVGMREDERRIFVVPAGYTTSVSESVTNVASQGAVYVVQLHRVEHVRDEDDNGEKNPAASAAAPPAVYAATEDADAHSTETRAVALVRSPTTATTAVGVPAQVDAAPSSSALRGSSAASAVPAFLSASGIPPEHMSVLRKVEVGVNAAVASARDVHDVTAIFSQEWRHFAERPKPSLLSNRALLEQVQRVVAEEETAQAHLDDCDRLLHTLEGRNKELQQRIDRATVESQKLLEAKNNAATKAMDARLEKDRHLVRLKDALLLKRQEHEDLQRHVVALQRTVDVTSEELRQVQGKRDIHQVEVASMAERLAAMQETLSEERHRNAALTAKTAMTEESIKKAQAQQRIAEGQLTTARGLAEKERLRYIQIMEEERHHRAQDSELLRQDILHELDARERQYHVDRHRLAEEHFSRGLRDGKAEGRQAAETDLVGHQDELRLNLQRAKAEVETIKEDVRRSIESAMTLRRTLGGKVSEMEAQLTSATRRQTELQYEVAQWQTRCRTVKDTVSQHWRTLLTYATHPCTKEELLALMAAVRAAEEASYAGGEDGVVRVDLQFQVEQWKQTRRASIEQRLSWLSSDLEDMYVKGAAYHYEHEWLHPVSEAHAATLEAVAQLYAAHHGSRALFDAGVQEAQERYALQEQWWATIHRIEEFLTAQQKAQQSLKAEESQSRLALWKAYVDGGDNIVQLCAAQLRAQTSLLQDEARARDEVAAEEAVARARLPADAAQMWAADCAAALHVLEEEEEAARAGLEAESYTDRSGITFQFAYATRGAEEAQQRRTEQETFFGLEGAARSLVEYEAAVSRRQVEQEATAALRPPPPPLTASEEEPPHPVPEVSAPEESAAQSGVVADATGDAPATQTGSPPAVPPTPHVSAAHASDVSRPPPPPTDEPSSHTDPELPLYKATVAAAFTLTDPPRVRRDPLSLPADTQNGKGVAAPSPQANLIFSDVPPPLPPSDEEPEEGDTPAQQTGRPAVPPPEPHHTPSKPRSEKATYADRDAPPPLPSENDNDSEDDGSSDSSSTTSSDINDTPAKPSAASTARPPTTADAAPAVAPTAKARAAPLPRNTIAAIEVDDGDSSGGRGGALPQDDAQQPNGPKAAKHMFGGSSSEDDSDSDEEGGREASTGKSQHAEKPDSSSRTSPASAQRAPALQNKKTSAAATAAKPKLFDSSDDD